MNKIIMSFKFLMPYVPYFIMNRIKKSMDKKQLRAWQKNGCPVPPPHIVKQITIAAYQQKFGYTTFVETGTFMGDMVQAQKKNFKQIISIELGNELYKKAKKRFINDTNVSIVLGDSGKMLPSILKDINNPAIFWLDGHYSEGITAKGSTDCPIFEELDAILDNKRMNHILLIDDARCFNGISDYPSIEKISTYISSKNVAFKVEVKDDTIRYVLENCN